MARLERSGLRRKVLMVSPRFLPRTGGVETHVHEVAHRLRKKGWDVRILTVDDTHSLPAREVIGDLPVERVASIRCTGEALVAPGLVSAIRDDDWDLVHIQHFHACVAPLALWAAWRAKVPIAVTFHGGGQRHWTKLRSWPPTPGMLAPLALDASAPLLRKADALIAVAHFEITSLAPRVGVPEDRFALVPNGCELPAVEGPPHVPDASAPQIVSMGRLVAGKGHERVLEALPHVLAERPGARLWIAGGGPHEDRLRNRARNLGVESQVEISAVPPSRRSELAARLRRMDVIVSMSDFEAHPIGVIEALGLGLTAVVANDGAGLAELASQGWARLVSKDTAAQGLAATILAAVDKPIKVAANAIPTWDDCANGIDRIYTAVLDAPRLQPSVRLERCEYREC